MIRFKGAHVVKDIILTCVRWSLASPLRDRQVGGRVERTPPVCRSAVYSPLLSPFGIESVTVFDPAPWCASCPSRKPESVEVLDIYFGHDHS
jgi:hypothetical protein